MATFVQISGDLSAIQKVFFRNMVGLIFSSEKLIIDRNNLSNPVYVGDTKGDLEGAKLAGILEFVHRGFFMSSNKNDDGVGEGQTQCHKAILP